MLYLAVCFCFAACALAAPASTDVVPLEKQQPTVIPIVSQSDELEPNGTYHFSYETGNGIKREEISYDKIVPKARSRSADSNEGGEDSDGDSNEIHVQMGSYSYTAPDGTLISVRYIADENGFQPIGDHIPRVPSASGSSSSEKSGRALKVADSVVSASAPVAAAKGAEKSAVAVPLSAAAPASKSAEITEAVSTTAPAESEASTESAEAVVASTTEPVKAPEAASTTVSTTAEEASTTVSASAEASTTEAAKNTESPSTPTPEQSTTNVEPSSTEAASTTTVSA